MAAVVLGLTALGWGLLLGVVAPRHVHVDSTQVFGVGLGVTAYALGMRHVWRLGHLDERWREHPRICPPEPR